LLDKDIERPLGGLYKFGPFVLDPAQRRLTKDGAPISLTVKSFDLLVLLVANNGKLLTKDEILGQVWDGAETYESSLTAHVSMLRQALGDTKDSRYIETVSKKGYRFTKEVECSSEAVQPISASRSPVRRVARWPFYIAGAVILVLAIATAVALWTRRPPLPAHIRLYREAVALERDGNDGLALQKLTEALRVGPDFAEANLRAAWISYDDDDNDNASTYVRALLTAKSPISNSVRLQAEALSVLLEGGREEAFNKLQLATEADPTNTYALYGLSEIAVDLGLFDQADQALQRCKAVDPEDALCAFEIVTLRVYQNRFADAVSEYERLRASNVKNPWLEEPVGFAKLGQGDLDGALRHFQALEEAGRKFASNVHFRASQEGNAAVALYQGKLQQARQQILDALETSNSSYDKAYYYLSLARMDALHHRGGDAVLDAKAASQASQAPDIAISAARALAMAGDHDSATALLSKHVEASAALGKQYPAAKQFVAGLRAMSKRQWDDAIGALKDSYRLEPSPETAYYLAQVQMSASYWNEAASTLDLVLKSKGTILMDSVASLIPLARYNLALCYERAGDYPHAKPLFESARGLWEHADPELRAALK